MAAQLSFYFLLASFPFLIFLSALIGFIPYVPDLLELMLADFSHFLPTETHELVKGILEGVVAPRRHGVLTFSLVMALWIASTAFNSMIGLLNRAYQARETRSYFRTRTLAVLVTVVVSIFLVMSGILLFFGDWAIDLLIKNSLLNALYTAFRWIIIFLLLNVGVQIIFHFLPARRLRWSLITPGGLLAVIGGLVGSQFFRFYVNRFADFQLLWGSLGALIALMIWFYICSFCLLLGGEIDSEVLKMRWEEAVAGSGPESGADAEPDSPRFEGGDPADPEDRVGAREES